METTVEMIRQHPVVTEALRRAAADRSGVAASEYAILAVAIVIIIGFAVVQLSDPTQGAFARVGSTVLSTQSGLSASIAGR